MTFIHIKKIQIPDGENTLKDAFAVPCVAISTPQGRKLIPNPAGSEAQLFPSLEEAEDAVRRAGFDYIFEGKMTSTLPNGGKSPLNLTAASGGRPLERAIPLLMQHLRDREPAVVANAALALGALRAQGALEALTDTLGHEDPNVRKNVADAMARLGLPAVHALREALIKARTSPQNNAPYVRLTVMSAYLEMLEQGAGVTALEQFLPLAVESLDDENWLVRAQAALVIGRAALAIEEEKNRQDNGRKENRRRE